MKLSAHARFSTVCIHAGQEPDPSTGAIITPIFQTSTYVQDALGEHKGFEYARTQNPTRATLEANLAAIEGGRGAFAFASGMSAINAIAARLEAGDHVIVTDNTYGGTFRLFDKVMKRYNIAFSFVDTSDLKATEAAFTPKTRLVFLETPTNPVLRLTDIAAVVAMAHARGVLVAVDNTFASPCLQRPILLGADLVVHSTTKYLNGHSDSIGGVVIGVRDDDLQWLKFIQNSAGAILSPFDSWLVLRGTKTMPLRMAQHSANGLALAQYLQQHKKVKKVIYPGLPEHPQHELAKRQMPNGWGGMLSFEMESFEATRSTLNRFRLMSLAESLGGVETLVCHPASMTHASVPPERRLAIGLSDNLIRISAGIEDIEDLKDDLAQALDG
ncbi:MAG TPA: PLP-dependent aspartate aminotransferase family protein [Vicinamibacterales bacterium]|nr:PLP-dependent aspartate aminotransferase family protein [Vicinamibacterales bacterium]